MDKETNGKTNIQTMMIILVVILLYISDFVLPNDSPANSLKLFAAITVTLIMSIRFFVPITHNKAKEILDLALTICMIKFIVTTDLKNIFDSIVEWWSTIKFIAITYFKIKITILMVQYLVDKKKSI
ncbi:MAG: hypothetical protein H6909_00895 [Rickettsiaceae bacterium]|nr:hypothetical protein [Rickettsiaceae bacterium]